MLWRCWSSLPSLVANRNKDLPQTYKSVGNQACYVDLGRFRAVWLIESMTIERGTIRFNWRGRKRSNGTYAALAFDDLEAAVARARDRLDVHALRYSFGTLLSKGGVSPRTAQAAMRHSSVDLTMNVYTDPRLLDVHAAVDALPELSLNHFELLGEEATGTAVDTTCDRFFVAPIVAPTRSNGSQFRSIPGKPTASRPAGNEPATVAASGWPVKRNKPLSLRDNGLQRERVTGLEPATASLGS